MGVRFSPLAMSQTTLTTDRVSQDHQLIHEAVDEIGILAEAVIRGRPQLAPVLDRRLDELRMLVARHHAHESRSVLPALARGNGWGVILARHLAEVHRHQLTLLEDAAAASIACPVERAVKIRVLALALRDDLDQEERWMALLPR